MGDLSDSSSSDADSPPCVARPQIKYDLAADAQLAVTSSSHGGSVRPAMQRDIVDVEQQAVAAPSSQPLSVVV
jgi:hypothetical protein